MVSVTDLSASGIAPEMPLNMPVDVLIALIDMCGGPAHFGRHHSPAGIQTVWTEKGSWDTVFTPLCFWIVAVM